MLIWLGRLFRNVLSVYSDTSRISLLDDLRDLVMTFSWISFAKYSSAWQFIDLQESMIASKCISHLLEAIEASSVQEQCDHAYDT